MLHELGAFHELTPITRALEVRGDHRPSRLVLPVGALASERSAYSQTKSALHFAVDRPLPIALVRKLLRARIAETKAKATNGTTKKRTARGQAVVRHGLR